MKINFKKFDKAPLVFALLFFLISCAVFFSIHKKIKSNTQVFKDAQVEWQMENSKKEEIIFLDRLFENSGENMALIDSHFIQGSDVVPFLDNLEKLATEAKTRAEVTLVDVSPEGTNLSVGVRITGTFINLYKFLTLLENSSYKVEITSMDMRKLADRTETSKFPEWSGIFKISLLSFIQ